MGRQPKLRQSNSAGAAKSDSLAYAHVWEHYSDELAFLDLRLQRVFLLRQEITPDPQTDAYRGMFISEDEFLRLIGGADLTEVEHGQLVAVQQELEVRGAKLEQRLAASKEQGVFLPVPYVSAIFGLNAMEQRIVMAAAAVELDRKYERVFGFLQDDLTSKLPNMGLLLQLVCRTPEEYRSARSAFAPTGKLARYFWNQDEQEPGGRSMLSRPVSLDRRMARFLLDSGAFDESLKPAARIHYPDELLPPLLVHEQVQGQLQGYLRQASQPLAAQGNHSHIGLYVWGKSGAGKKLQVLHVCKELNKPLVLVDLSLIDLTASEADFTRGLRQLVREAMLHQAALGFSRLEVLYPDEPDMRAKRYVEIFHHILDSFDGWLFLMGESLRRLNGEARSRVWLDAELSVPEDQQRVQLWESFARELKLNSTANWAEMGGKFKFTPGQIRRSLSLAVERAQWTAAGKLPHAERNEEGVLVSSELLIEACYSQVQHKLERKATRIVPRYGWDDIVLPEEQKDQLRSACHQVKYRTLVYGSWGFERKLAYGKGLSMLFAGPPGTGKTMSAQVVAKELQLELYKIDLSQVISKYIGETEKNLHEIFQEAESSQAVLFFDETDALFGKRSEVKDSHDKYANIETAYLLQKMEEYQGISVLATNLLQNIDEAFLRRINYIVKFPFPDAVYRESLWQSQFPPEAPLADDVDFKYLARKYEMAGGNIKNVVLTAAFMAASRNEPIRMRHLIHSVKQELQKSGKIMPANDLDEF